MTPATYTIPSHTSGDMWAGISSLTITINSVAPTVALASARIQFRKSAAGSVVLELSTADDTILIESAANWEISVPKIVVSIPAGVYVYDLQTVDGDGDTKTYLGGTWTILEDITR